MANLVLIGHGSPNTPDAGRPLRLHADNLRARGVFDDVRLAFLRQPPFLAEALEGMVGDRTYVVPVMACKGRVTRDLIPREMKLSGPVTKRPDGTTVCYCDPVGAHPAMVDVIARRVSTIMEANGLASPDTSVILAAHGSSRGGESSAHAKEVAGLLAGKNVCGQVHAAFLEEPPFLKDWAGHSDATSVIVVPFLFSDGVHGTVDVPGCLGIEPTQTLTDSGPFAVAGRRLWCCRPVGHEAAVADMVVTLISQFDGLHGT